MWIVCLCFSLVEGFAEEAQEGQKARPVDLDSAQVSGRIDLMGLGFKAPPKASLFLASFFWFFSFLVLFVLLGVCKKSIFSTIPRVEIKGLFLFMPILR